MTNTVITTILLVILAANLCSGQDEVPGKLISKKIEFRSNRIAPSCSNQYGPVCADCNTLWTCVGGDAPVRVQNCEITHPGKPYCVENACSNSIPQNSNCAAELRCTSQGYFPNPTNCSQYYFCGGPSGASRVYECPQGFAYNPLSRQCRRVANESYCIQVNCTENDNRYVAYGGDRGYYAFCLSDLGVSQPVMFKCPDSDNFKFNQESQRCEFECRWEGRVRDYTNCRGYYECFRIGNEFINQRNTCLDGFVFNEYWQECMPGECAVGLN